MREIRDTAVSFCISTSEVSLHLEKYDESNDRVRIEKMNRQDDRDLLIALIANEIFDEEWRFDS